MPIMLDPYRMVLINLIASIVLISGVLIYRFVYTKKKINLFVLMLLVSILPLISILRKGAYESGDMSMHSIFAMEFYDSLLNGNLIPKWAGNVYFGYGYPLFLFIYPLPYYLISLIHFLGLSFISSFKLIIGLSFVLSGIFMYKWINEKLGKIPAFTAALFYLFAPYHLVDIHFRSAIGEAIAFPMIPVVFLLFDKLFKSKEFKHLILLTVGLFMLILTHQAIALVTFIILAFYIFFNWNNKKRNINNLALFYSPFIFSILLSAFYWIPLLYEANKYTNLIPNPEIYFPQFWQFIYSPWRWGLLFQGPKGELSFIVGYLQLIVIIIALFFVFKNNLKNNLLLKFSLFSFFIIFLLIQSFSKPIWDFIFILKNFQFSYRLLLFLSFFTSIIAAYVAKLLNSKYFTVAICFLVVATTILNWGNRKTLPEINDQALKKETSYILGKDGNIGLGSTIWLDNKILKITKPFKDQIEIIKGKADIVRLSRTPEKHEYLIKTFETTKFRENTLYFPGWLLKINNSYYSFEYENKEYPGIIIFSLPRGTYKADLVFEDTPIRKASMALSLTTFLLFSVWIIYKLKNSDRIIKLK